MYEVFLTFGRCHGTEIHGAESIERDAYQRRSFRFGQIRKRDVMKNDRTSAQRRPSVRDLRKKESKRLREKKRIAFYSLVALRCLHEPRTKTNRLRSLPPALRRPQIGAVHVSELRGKLVRIQRIIVSSRVSSPHNSFIRRRGKTVSIGASHLTSGSSAGGRATPVSLYLPRAMVTKLRRIRLSVAISTLEK